MVQVWQRIRQRLPQLRQFLLIAAALGAVLAASPARKFCDDDPLWHEPKPMPVAKANKRDIVEQYEFFVNTFREPYKEQRKEDTAPRAQNTNTMDEVPDSNWYTNRFGSPDSIPHQHMSQAELVLGPGNANQPSMDGPWTILSNKNTGVTPGFNIVDSKGKKFILKFDPPSNPDLTTAVDVIGCKFFYDVGYNVPENHIVYFTRTQLQLTEKSRHKEPNGRQRPMNQRDVDDILSRTSRDREGRYRAMASFFIPGDIIGPFRFTGMRTDDPNDIVPHEDRRELRGLYVFAAWLNHGDAKSGNTLDSLVDENGLRYIKHYLVDFGAILGSASLRAKNPADGHENMFNIKPAGVQFATLGLDVPRWDRATYREVREAGRFEATAFDADDWKPDYPNVAFDLRRPDDDFWGAKRVMAFTDGDIRAIVSTGDYSDPKAGEWIASALIARRDKIGRAFFSQLLPLDNFRVSAGKLEFDDLAVKYGFSPARSYQIQWSRFDNNTDRKEPLTGATGPGIPANFQNAAAGAYIAAYIVSDNPQYTVTAYLRKTNHGFDVVGIDRKW
jgi:hypothetical protein